MLPEKNSSVTENLFKNGDVIIKKHLCFILTITFVFLLCSCDSKDAELVNLWIKEPGDTIEFFKDGTFIEYKNGKERSHGDYVISGDTIKFSNAFDANTCKYSINGKVLTLKETGEEEAETYYLYDNNSKKPAQKLSEDKAKKLCHYKEDEIYSIKFDRSYTDDDGYYHNVFSSVINETGNPYKVGRLTSLDYVYMSSPNEWIFFYYETGEYVITDNILLGKWKYSDNNITAEVNINSYENEIIKGNYYFKKKNDVEKDDFSEKISLERLYDNDYMDEILSIQTSGGWFADYITVWFHNGNLFANWGDIKVELKKILNTKGLMK